tara:strand:- start:817 stop:1575 length:759 start_codon:yes stop_codon:yes gene_type:complete
MLEIIILSFIQGVTEFLPISSSSHLIIIANYLNFSNQNLTLDVSLHIGSFLAVLVFFNKEILSFFKNTDLFLKILISSIPTILIGFILVKTGLIDKLRNIEVIGWTTIIFGILLYYSDKFKLDKTIDNNYTYKSALIIGLLQILSLVPGVSRSGIAITAARLLNFKRYDSAKISFLLSIPTLAAVSIYGITNIFSSQNLFFSYLNFFSIIFSFIVSFLTIKYFLEYIKKFNLNVFVLYRIILGAIILSISYL